MKTQTFIFQFNTVVQAYTLDSLNAGRGLGLVPGVSLADYAAFAKGQCTTGLRNLQTFQNKVLAQVAEIDSVLADHLIAGAQAIIDSGCGN